MRTVLTIAAWTLGTWLALSVLATLAWSWVLRRVARAEEFDRHVEQALAVANEETPIYDQLAAEYDVVGTAERITREAAR